MTTKPLTSLRMVTTVDAAWEALAALGQIVYDNTDRDGDWEDDISSEVADVLYNLGVLVRCDDCAGGPMLNGGDCSREHPCSTCGYFDCECCGDCGNYECTCEADADEEEGGL